MQDNFDRFLDGAVPTEDYRVQGEIQGLVKRSPGVGQAEARKRAATYAWYDSSLRYDGRSKRWHIFRCAS